MQAESTIGKGNALKTLDKFLSRVSERLKREGIGDAYPFILPTANEGIHTAVKSDLMMKGIPFREVRNSSRIIIADRSMANEIRKADLNTLRIKARGCYGQELTKKDLDAAIAATAGIKDKNIVSFTGLEERMAEKFKSELDKVAPRFITATEKDSRGKTGVYIARGLMDIKTREKTAKAYLSALVKTYGLNSGVANGESGPSVQAFFRAAAERSLINGVDRVIRLRCEKSTRPDYDNFFTLYLVNARHVLRNLDSKSYDRPDQAEEVKKATDYLKFIGADNLVYAGAADISEMQRHTVKIYDAVTAVPTHALAAVPEAKREGR